MKKQRYYGRKDVNKLDWMFAIAWVIIALGAIWISIGLSLERAGNAAVPAFLDVLHGLGFQWFTEAGPAIVVIIDSIIFYVAVAYLIFGIIFFCLKNKKERIPGAVATFFALLGTMVFLSLIFELTTAEAAKLVPLYWPYGLIFFLVLLFALACISVFATLTNCDVCIGEKHKEAEKTVVKEVVRVVEKQEEPAKKEEPKKEPAKEEPKKEPAKEEPKKEPAKKEEPEEEPADEEEGGFHGFGPRRRKVPFEEKLGKADKETKERYKMILDALKEFELSERVSVPGHSFSYKKEKLVFITFGGNTLKAYIAVDPKSYAESTIPVRDASKIKKFEQTPSMLYIKSNLAARRVVDLAKEALSNYKVPRKLN